MEAFPSALELHIPGCCFQAKNNNNNELVSCTLNQSIQSYYPHWHFRSQDTHQKTFRWVNGKSLIIMPEKVLFKGRLKQNSFISHYF